MSESVVIGRRDSTTAGSGYPSRDAKRGLSLPPDLLAQTSLRLQLVALSCLGLFALTRFVYGPALDRGPESDLTAFDHGLFATGALACMLTVAVARKACSTSIGLQRVGAIFYVYIAFQIALMSQSTPLQFAHPEYGNLPRHGVSWVAAWTLMYFTLVPSPPRLVLMTGLIGASSDPVMTYLLEWWSNAAPDAFERLVGYRDQPHPGLVNVLAFYSFNYAFALVAVLPAKVLQRLVHQVRRARRMGSYHLVRRLGEGGMGEVWLARHRMLARPAAIKLIRAELMGTSSPEAAESTLRRFEREAQATATLRSPHSIQLYDFGRTPDGTFYYVMELLDGLNLEQLVQVYGPLGADRVVHVLRQTCHSLSDAHARDLVHRDVKPANIFLCRMGQDVDFVKVLDFGLVRSTADHGAVTATRTAEAVATGTPAYMAPETAMGNREPDARVDIYALGCVAYWLLTGQLVFEATTPVQMAVLHVKEQVVPPSRRSEIEVPGELEELVLRCLEKEPGARPQSVTELAGELDRLSARHPWTAEKARAWWERHNPVAGVDEELGKDVDERYDDPLVTHVIEHSSNRRESR